jgi:nicotinamide phosphoribosyltransferase
MIDYKSNIILNTDGYKPSHWLQYPPNTKKVFSYISSRGGVYPYTVFFGLQKFLKDVLSVKFTQKHIDEAADFFVKYGEPFNKSGWEKMLSEYGGRLPLLIRAVPEGTIVPVGHPLVSVINTDKRFGWVTSYIETALLRGVWYPTTVATVSHSIKKVILDALERTGDASGINFKLHDFGSRGVSSFESSAIGGSAHLINFLGTDNIVGILALMESYASTDLAGVSIPAAEHSSITSWGRDHEKDAYKNMVEQFGGSGKVFAVVSDSYDIMKACDLWGELKDLVVESQSILVVRPDSGDPATIVTEVVRRLDKHYGSVVNGKGYRVLNNVRVIQGDGINEVSIRGILMNLEFAGYSADNVAFGMGGALLQHMNRDTNRFAMKASAALIRDEWVDVYKEPVTDPGKASLRGLVTTMRKGSEFKTVREEDLPRLEADGWENLMKPVWENGVLLKDFSLEEVKKNVMDSGGF